MESNSAWYSFFRALEVLLHMRTDEFLLVALCPYTAVLELCSILDFSILRARMLSVGLASVLQLSTWPVDGHLLEKSSRARHC